MIAKLPEEFTLAHAAKSKLILLEALEAGDDVLVDGTCVQAIDLSGLQLLCAAHKSAVEAGRRFEFVQGGRGEVIDRAATIAGLDRHAACVQGCLFQRGEHDEEDHDGR